MYHMGFLSFLWRGLLLGFKGFNTLKIIFTIESVFAVTVIFIFIFYLSLFCVHACVISGEFTNISPDQSLLIYRMGIETFFMFCNCCKDKK